MFFVKSLYCRTFQKVFIVNNGLVLPFEKILKQCKVQYHVFDKTQPNPTVKNVEEAYQDGRYYQARKNMLHAAYKAGVAFSKSYVGYIHAIAHSLGGQYGTPHGLANAVIMPYVLEEYGKSVYKKLYELGVAAGVCDKKDFYKEGAEKFISAIKKLNRDMGIPSKIAGIKKEDIPAMAKHAEQEANPLYPVPKLMTKKQLEKFYFKVADWSNEL